MTTRFVKICLPYRLPCAKAVRNDVVLCLQDEALIVQPVPACLLPITTIEAKICQTYTLSDGCTNIVWNYTFSYDDTQLTNPTTPLVASDITGVFCLDCLTDWIEERVSCSGSGINCVTDSATIDFSITQDNCLTGFVKVSADENNIVTTHADGLYATLCVIDSQSTNLTLDVNNCLIVDVNISADGGNALTLHSDGLYVAAGGGGSGWLLTGNAGTVDGTNFLGTTDNVPFEIRVNGHRALRIEPPRVESQGPPIGFNTVNIIGGSEYNAIINSSDTGNNAILSGGIGNFEHNTIDGSVDQCGSCLIVGGTNSHIYRGSGASAIVCGINNLIEFEDSSVIVCGQGHQISGGAQNFIGGGGGHIIGPLDSTADTDACNQCSVLGGGGNQISNENGSCILGGGPNVISSAVFQEFGSFNFVGCAQLGIVTDCTFSGILCGNENTIVSGNYSVILGGRRLKLGNHSLGYQADLGSSSNRDLSAFSGLGFFGDIDLWIGNSDNTARKLKFFEPNTTLNYSGTNYSSLEAQAQSADIQYKLPAAAGTPGQQLTIDTVVGTVVTLKWA